MYLEEAQPIDLPPYSQLGVWLLASQPPPSAEMSSPSHRQYICSDDLSLRLASLLELSDQWIFGLQECDSVPAASFLADPGVWLLQSGVHYTTLSS